MPKILRFPRASTVILNAQGDNNQGLIAYNTDTKQLAIIDNNGNVISELLDPNNYPLFSTDIDDGTLQSMSLASLAQGAVPADGFTDDLYLRRYSTVGLGGIDFIPQFGPIGSATHLDVNDADGNPYQYQDTRLYYYNNTLRNTRYGAWDTLDDDFPGVYGNQHIEACWSNAKHFGNYTPARYSQYYTYVLFHDSNDPNNTPQELWDESGTSPHPTYGNWYARPYGIWDTGGWSDAQWAYHRRLFGYKPVLSVLFPWTGSNILSDTTPGGTGTPHHGSMGEGYPSVTNSRWNNGLFSNDNSTSAHGGSFGGDYNMWRPFPYSTRGDGQTSDSVFIGSHQHWSVTGNMWPYWNWPEPTHFGYYDLLAIKMKPGYAVKGIEIWQNNTDAMNGHGTSSSLRVSGVTDIVADSDAGYTVINLEPPPAGHYPTQFEDWADGLQDSIDDLSGSTNYDTTGGGSAHRVASNDWPIPLEFFIIRRFQSEPSSEVQSIRLVLA